MRVLILGGGTVGFSVAKRLQTDHEVTVVERRKDRAESIDAEVDGRVICGDASQAQVLVEAGAKKADVCFALTGSDETNMLASSVVKEMGARRVAARVYSRQYRDWNTFDYRRHFRIDRFLSLEYLTAVELARRFREPGAMLVEHFACGELEMQEVSIVKNTTATNIPLRDLKLPSEIRVGAIKREGRISIASADDEIMVGDLVTLLGAREEVERAKKTFATQSIKKQNVTIVGGGEVGFNLASILQNRNCYVKLIERDYERCNFLAQKLGKLTTVHHGDGRRKNFLDEESVGDADVFVACAGQDEDNIVACVEAKELGCPKALAVVEHQDYAGVVKKLGIDEVVSPFEVIERQVEGFMHEGPLVFHNSTLLGKPIEALELEVEKDSIVTVNPLKDVGIPKRTLIAAVIRENKVLIPNATFTFESGDSVVALTEAPQVDDLVNLFRGVKNS